MSSGLAGVLAALDDDAPRLVYADGLLEQGAPSAVARGEFIQVSCALAKLPDEPTEERARLVRRAMELLGAWELTWVDELLTPLFRRRVWDARAADWRWSRGFIEGYRKGTGLFTFGEELEAIQERTPLVDVEVSFREADELRGFLARPGLRHLRRLSVQLWAALGPEALAAIASTSALASLERLHVSWDGHDELEPLLSKADAFPRLRELSLEQSGMDSRPMTAREVKALMSSPLAKTVRSLSLERDVIGERLSELTKLPFQLERLEVRANDGGALLRLLADGEAYPSLRAVGVDMRYGRGEPWSLEGAMGALAAHPRLERLELSGKPERTDLRPLFMMPEAARLRSLELTHDQLGDEVIDALASATHLTRLRELDLSYNDLTNDGVKRLVKAKHLLGLKRLALRRSGRLGVAPFTGARGFDDLEHLDLRDDSLPEKSPAIDKLRQRFGAAAITGYDPEVR